jgi:arsenate reductase-like glutaredoxin family protein
VRKKTPRPKKSYVLKDEEEEKLLEWIEENEMLWNSKMKDYRRADKKAARWEDMAEQMGKTSKELQGWWQGIKDQFTKLHRKKSGQAARLPTERQQWIQRRCKFLERVVRHKAASVRPVSKNYGFIIKSNKFFTPFSLSK